MRTGTQTHPGLAGGFPEDQSVAVASDPSHGGVRKSVPMARVAPRGTVWGSACPAGFPLVPTSWLWVCGWCLVF